MYLVLQVRTFRGLQFVVALGQTKAADATGPALVAWRLAEGAPTGQEEAKSARDREQRPPPPPHDDLACSKLRDYWALSLRYKQKLDTGWRGKVEVMREERHTKKRGEKQKRKPRNRVKSPV